MNEGATEGERKAARAAATRIARAAGMTLLDAYAAVDNAPKPKPTVNFFEGFADWMEEKHPGWKAREAAKKRERENRAAARRAELLKQHSTIKAVFDPTPWEIALETAIAPFVLEWGEFTDISETVRRYARKIDSIDREFTPLKDMAPPVVEAVENAYPLPDTLAEALDEVRAWDRLRKDREVFIGGEWHHPTEVEARISVIENILETRPAASLEDMQARFDWKRYEWERQWIDPSDHRWEHESIIGRLEDDLRILRNLHQATAQNGHAGSRRRTNADKRAEVLSILDANPDLSDREIARRAGVSPQTVNTWRKKRRVQI